LYCYNTIAEDITFDDAPSPQYLRVNTTALVRCVVSAQPEAVVTWRFNNTRLTPGISGLSLSAFFVERAIKSHFMNGIVCEVRK
jgi:hypothetical protein